MAKVFCPICKVNKIDPRSNSCRSCQITWPQYKEHKNEKWLRQKYINEEKSLKDIAKIVGCCWQTISTWLNWCEVPRRGFGSRGKKHPQWKGGRFIRSDGYVLIYVSEKAGMGDPYILEHRLVMEKHLGRKLKKGEIVHHIDGNRQNNKIENLELKDLKTHSAMGYKQGYEEGFSIGQIKGFINGIFFISLGIIKKN